MPPCRPCDQKVTLSQRDYRTLAIDAKKGRDLKTALAAMTAARDNLARELDALRRERNGAPPGPPPEASTEGKERGILKGDSSSPQAEGSERATR